MFEVLLFSWSRRNICLLVIPSFEYQPYNHSRILLLNFGLSAIQPPHDLKQKQLINVITGITGLPKAFFPHFHLKLHHQGSGSQGRYRQERAAGNPSLFRPLPSTFCFLHSISLAVPRRCRSHGEPRTFQEEEEKKSLCSCFWSGWLPWCCEAFNTFTSSSSAQDQRTTVSCPIWPPWGLSHSSPRIWGQNWSNGFLSLHSHSGQDITGLNGKLTYPKQDGEVRKVCQLPLEFHVLCSSFSTPSGKAF